MVGIRVVMVEAFDVGNGRAALAAVVGVGRRYDAEVGRRCCGADTGYVVFQTEKAKKDAIIAAMRVSDLLVDTVNGGVQESFVNEKRALTATIARFAKQTDQWLAAYVEQEIGDFENWMKTMEFDCKALPRQSAKFIKRNVFYRLMSNFECVNYLKLYPKIYTWKLS
ncbi:hypothetical protein RJ639_046763 [Escallonia herrerae]|uniref:Biogenesis of lysosome-related organelles complex 1 subunit 1 n=1 Tax=Escallonia herrerae TaxID=1293975 RepID=A0AA88WBW3_9ASTE|nr:hypothetical protein RJ639_046763 [Escallonia herrerae]